MTDREPLSDNEAHDRLHAALLAVGDTPARTPWADTALKTARRALNVLMLGLIVASEEDARERGSSPPE